MTYASSAAVDKENVNQSISGSNPVVITASNVLWDFNGDFDTATSDFVVPATGIYQFDMQMRVKTMINVTAVEIAVFKRGVDEEEDEFWFTQGKQYVNLVDSTVHFSSVTRFNMVEGERYCIKAILTGILPAATIDGADTLTSWEFSYMTDMTGH